MCFHFFGKGNKVTGLINRSSQAHICLRSRSAMDVATYINTTGRTSAPEVKTVGQMAASKKICVRTCAFLIA